MKDMMIILLSAVIVVVFTSASFATGEQSSPQVPKLERAANVWQLTGGVSVVDTSAKSITVTGKIKDRVLTAAVMVDDKTKIMKDGKNMTFGDIKTGDKVVATYTKVDGKNRATSITIQSSKPESKEQ